MAALLRQAGAELVGYDPALSTGSTAVEPTLLTVVDEPQLAVKGADAVVILTEWPQFRTLDWGSLAAEISRADRGRHPQPARPRRGRPGGLHLGRSGSQGPGGLMSERTGAAVALTADGVTVLVDATEGRLPALLHWGRALPRLDEAQVDAIRAARVPVIGSNNTDVPLRVAVLPELHAGWLGRPGLSGSRAGRSWSPRFTTTSVRLDGAEVSGFVQTGAGRLEVAAVDSEAGLELQLTLALLPSGLLRSRAAITNTADDAYGLDELVLAYPVPAEAAELLDFGGRHNRERIPQRVPFSVGTHLRENRKGRTGADSAYLLHAGTPGFGFADGEIFAVHTAWSGNHTHFAERVFTGERVLGGGELLLPGEIRLQPGDTYQGAVAVRGVRDRAGRGGRSLPPAPARPPGADLRGPSGHPQRVGGGVLRPRPGPAAGAGRARGRGRRRALRAGRRLVRRPPQRRGRSR